MVASFTPARGRQNSAAAWGRGDGGAWEQQKARTDDGSSVKASQLNNANRLFGFNH
jgi:hypothetical protein